MVDEDFQKIQNELWDVVNQHVGPEDQEIILAMSGSMIAIAIELYTVVLTDEDIESLLEAVAKDIPLIRKKMANQIGKRILH